MKNKMHIQSFQEFNESISFLHDGVDIKNPFVDVSGIKKVDPIKYYGKDFSTSKAAVIVEDLDKLCAKWIKYKKDWPMSDATDDELSSIDEFLFADIEKLYLEIKNKK